jgi:putative transposase
VVILGAILEELLEHPFYGYRKLWRAIKDLDVTVKQIRRIMIKAGLRAIFAGKRTSIPAKGHARYPYLLRGKDIWLPNQVSATDIPYIRLKEGYVYLVAIIDLYSRRVPCRGGYRTPWTPSSACRLWRRLSRYGACR